MSPVSGDNEIKCQAVYNRLMSLKRIVYYNYYDSDS